MKLYFFPQERKVKHKGKCRYYSPLFFHLMLYLRASCIIGIFSSSSPVLTQVEWIYLANLLRILGWCHCCHSSEHGSFVLLGALCVLWTDVISWHYFFISTEDQQTPKKTLLIIGTRHGVTISQPGIQGCQRQAAWGGPAGFLRPGCPLGAPPPQALVLIWTGQLVPTSFAHDDCSKQHWSHLIQSFILKKFSRPLW